jgi:hypothetical protein
MDVVERDGNGKKRLVIKRKMEMVERGKKKWQKEERK